MKITMLKFILLRNPTSKSTFTADFSLETLTGIAHRKDFLSEKGLETVFETIMFN